MKSKREILVSKIDRLLFAINSLNDGLSTEPLFVWQVNDRSVRVHGLTDALLSLQLLLLHRIPDVCLYHCCDDEGRYLEFFICV